MLAAVVLDTRAVPGAVRAVVVVAAGRLGAAAAEEDAAGARRAAAAAGALVAPPDAERAEPAVGVTPRLHNDQLIICIMCAWYPRCSALTSPARNRVIFASRVIRVPESLQPLAEF